MNRTEKLLEPTIFFSLFTINAYQILFFVTYFLSISYTIITGMP